MFTSNSSLFIDNYIYNIINIVILNKINIMITIPVPDEKPDNESDGNFFKNPTYLNLHFNKY
jgi:hypothetical protein